jgi:hypothetical protein
MPGIRSLAGAALLSIAFAGPARAQSPPRPTILVDGHVALDTILSVALTKAVHETLTNLVRGTGVGLAPLFAPSTDLNGKPFTGDIDEVLSAGKLHGADIVVELNAMQSQDGNMFLAPTIVLRHSAAVDMAPLSGQTASAIARNAGIQHAPTPTAAINASTAASVAGS